MENSSHRVHSAAESLENDCWYHNLRLRYTWSWWKEMVVVDDQCARILKRKQMVNAGGGASLIVLWPE